MKKIFFTPGPTELYPIVKQEMLNAIETGICSIYHRSKDFENIFSNTITSLKILLNIPDNYHIFFVSSAAECMDRLIQNCVTKKSFHFVNGAFSKLFYNVSLTLKKNAIRTEVPFGESFDFSNCKIPSDSEMICFTHNETSTGVILDISEIYKIKESYPNSLVILDIVTSAPYANIDFNKIDGAFFSVQKGFGMPAGLGVLIVNNKCIEKAKYLKSSGINIGYYHNLLLLLENANKFQTTETPNVLGIYLLGKVCNFLNEYGIEKIREETEIKSKLLYNFFEEWNQGELFVKDKKSRSKTIIVANTQNPFNIKEVLEKNGYIIGLGYRDYKKSQLRIANFPMHKLEDVEKIIEILKTK